MKKIMIKIMVLTLLLTANTNANAVYTAVYGKAAINSDNISFVMSGKWVNTTPIITEWINNGSPIGCSVWTPDPSTKDLGTSFEQLSTGCSQKQTRTVQNREQNDYTLNYRNIGTLVTETQTLTNQTIKRLATGTKVVAECNVPNSVWTAGTSGYQSITIKFNGIVVYTGGDYTSTEKVVGIYKYTKGGLTGNGGYYTTSAVCRTAL